MFEITCVNLIYLLHDLFITMSISMILYLELHIHTPGNPTPPDILTTMKTVLPLATVWPDIHMIIDQPEHTIIISDNLFLP